MKTNPEISSAEASLIRKARAGNSEAFSELVRIHSDPIYCMSLRILKNHADAEDNLQDVLFKAYRNIRRFQGRSRFSSWLCRITINEALMKIRKASSARAPVQTDLPEEASDKGHLLEIKDERPNPERQYIAVDLAEKAFSRLHPTLKQTFLLHKGEGWTHRELAGAMGIAVATVRSRVFRARASVQHHLNAIC